jgi:proteasome lid subunit RPN8/RPN11
MPRRPAGDVLILNAAAEQAMKVHAESGYPREVCGLLVGRVDSAGGARRVLEATQAANLNRERARDRYDLDPADYLRIESDARARRLEVLGVYHSHPDHPSAPSETDRLRAEEIWQEAVSWSYLILEVASGNLASRRSWVLRERAFQEEEIRVDASGAGSL